jgi:hypothetical protein
LLPVFKYVFTADSDEYRGALPGSTLRRKHD